MKILLLLAAATLSAQNLSLFSFDSPESAPQASLSWSTRALGGGRAQVEVVITIPEGYHIDLQPEFLRLDPIGLEGPLRAESLVWSEPGLRQGVPSFSGSLRLYRVVYGLDGPRETEFSASWQICDDEGVCFAPVSETAALVLDPGSPFTPEFLLQLAFAFFGGLLLNLMPCVFPLLGIKALSLARLGQKSPAQRTAVTLAYGLGIETAMLAAALAIMLAGWLGAATGWGLHFQNPAFLVVTGGLLWAMALSLWGVYPIPALGFAGKGETVGGSYLTGLFAVLAAAPCTAPFLGGALAFALSLPGILSIPFFLSAGLGFALPYLLLGFLPALAAKLPKPGAWMESFERLMGFLMAGTALYILSPLVGMTGSEGTSRTGMILFISSFLLFAAGRWASLQAPAWRRRLLWLGAFAGMGLSALLLMPVPVSSTELSGEADTQDGWEKFSTQTLLEARISGRPVFVDIRADWCSNCKLNEATVFSDKELMDWIDSQGVLRLKGDYTLPDPDIAAWLSENRRAGLPVYALYPAGGSEPEFLPEILSNNLVRASIISITNGGNLQPNQ